MIKLIFFINGFAGSAADVRAKNFAQRLPAEWEIRFNYRPNPKWKGIFPFIQSALQFNPNIIYVMDTAYTGVIAGVVSKCLTNCKMITDTGDVAFELAKSKGTYSTSQLVLIQWIEQLATYYSDCLVVRGSYHKKWLSKNDIHSVECVPDGVDMDTIQSVQPIEALELRKQLGLENNLVVGLVGTMSWSQKYQICYGWDVVEALGLLKDLPIKGLLIGDGNGRTILEQRAEELGISDKIIFTGQIPYQNLPRYLATMDVCVSTQSNNLVGKVRTTGKLPLYLAYGKYVVATNVGEASLVLPDVGYLLPYEGIRDNHHPVRLAHHLRILVSQPQLLQVSEKAKQVAMQHFDYNLLAQQVKYVCQTLVSITGEEARS